MKGPMGSGRVVTGENRSDGVFRLNHAFSRCRHGHEIRDVSAKAAGDGWLIWGHYACRQCDSVALDHVLETPRVAMVGERKLPIIFM
jgi:hypothetical protein